MDMIGEINHNNILGVTLQAEDNCENVERHFWSYSANKSLTLVIQVISKNNGSYLLFLQSRHNKTK